MCDIDNCELGGNSISPKTKGKIIPKHKERIYHDGISFQGLRDKVSLHKLDRLCLPQSNVCMHSFFFSLTSYKALLHSKHYIEIKE